jgi:Flp pilus assembly protein TadB
MSPKQKLRVFYLIYVAAAGAMYFFNLYKITYLGLLFIVGTIGFWIWYIKFYREIPVKKETEAAP